MKHLKLFSLLLLIFLSSCSSGKTLKVYRDDLTPEVLKEGTISFEIEEKPFYCYLSVHGENKILVQETLESKNTHFAAVNYIYYIGVENGEFGGWVGYGVHFEDFSKSGKVIIEEQCQGLIKVDNEKVLLLTGLSHLVTDEGKLYLLEGGEIQELFDFKSCPQVYYWENETLYIRTTDKIYSYKLDEEPVELYEFKDDEKYTYSNSMVKIDQSMFLGSLNGILEYQMDTKETFWYPVE